jgi:ABC-2 type transport system ATP-binding protein
VAGHDLFETPDAVHAVLGYMPDLAPVIPDLRVWEFLDLYAGSYGYGGMEKRDRVDACLAKVKLGDKRSLYGRELSRGMTQRVVLAKTLLHDPRLLLLDEPASGMDPIARRDLRHILQEVAAAGATVLISSHILSELADMCTSVGIMHQGVLVRHGTMAGVMSSVDVQHVDIEMELIDAADVAVGLLSSYSGVDAVRVEGLRVSFTFRGDRHARAELLKHVFTQGLAVSAFTPRKHDIESVLVRLVEER